VAAAVRAGFIPGLPERPAAEAARPHVAATLRQPTPATVSQAQTALPADTMIDSGFTASQLGALSQWNAGKPATGGEYAKLCKPYTDTKPGKIAYALAYKATLAP